MFETFKVMMKEEWRIHSVFFGGTSFALFPVILSVLAFVGFIMLPIIKLMVSTTGLIEIFQYSFLMFGLSVGAFGLLGREVMNRRFGSASLIAYSSRTLPVSEKNILANFFIKDVIYYFSLWLLPIFVGFTGASFFLSLGFAYSASFLLVMILSFMLGLSTSFFLSTLYAHSIKLLGVFLLAAALIGFVFLNHLSLILPIFSLIPTTNRVTVAVLVISILSILSLQFPKIDYPQRKKLYNNSLRRLSHLFSFSKLSSFMSKDILDFNRSEGGVGKIILSFLIPLAIVWVLIDILMNFMFFLNPLITFSIFLGIVSSSFYNWFTEYDSFNFYAFLPIKVSTIIKSKVNNYILINLVSVMVLILVTMLTKGSASFILALITFVSVSSYALSVTILLAGLNPNIMLYNPKIFLEYVAMIAPVILVFIFLSALSLPAYIIVCLLLIPVSFKILQKSYRKWETKEQMVFWNEIEFKLISFL